MSRIYYLYIMIRKLVISASPMTNLALPIVRINDNYTPTLIENLIALQLIHVQSVPRRNLLIIKVRRKTMQSAIIT